jgi:hypothetical protein
MKPAVLSQGLDYALRLHDGQGRGLEQILEDHLIVTVIGEMRSVFSASTVFRQ